MSYQQPYPTDPQYSTQPQYPTPPQYPPLQQTYPPQQPYGQPPFAETPYPPTPPYPTYPPPPPQKRDTNLPLIITIATATLLILAVVVVLAVRPGGFLNGNNSVGQNTPQNTPITNRTSPTATPITSTFSILYQAQASDNGFAAWRGTSQWSVSNSNGVVSSDGNGTGNILAPYSPGNAGINDYEVDANIQILDVKSSFFGVVVRAQGDPSNLSGYIGGMAGATNSGGGASGNAAISYIGYTGNALKSLSYHVDPGWHTYTLIVIGSDISLEIDGTTLLTLHDSTFSSGGAVGIRAASGSRIAVRTFVVTKLD